MSDAINGKGAFRRSKDVLGYYPEERQQWFRFSGDALRRRMVEWLAGEGIEPMAVEKESP